MKYQYDITKLKGSKTKAKIIKEIDSMLKAHAKYCAYCGKYLKDNNEKTIDHIVPKSQSGPDTGINKVVCCKECNQRKANIPFHEFKKTIDRQILNKYLSSFGNLQLASGEHYAIAIQKKFKL